MLRKDISENLVSLIWEYQILTDPVTDAGERVCVIYPGRPDSDGGCDFRDAVLIVGVREVRGDIEVHVKSSDWLDHGHHRDRRYNTIILHVVMFNDLPYQVTLQNGQTIPTINLEPFITSPLASLNNRVTWSKLRFSCSNVKGYSLEFFLSILHLAGKKWFEEKEEVFSEMLLTDSPGQVLYRGIARAMGYSKNTKPFEKLANLLPLAKIESLQTDDEITLRALIIGSAGLLQSQQVPVKTVLDHEAIMLERAWNNLHLTNTLNHSEWNLFRVRPCNSPVRRMVALSGLLSKYKRGGLLNGILNMVLQTPESNPYNWIYNTLICACNGYRENNIHLGMTMGGKSAILGRSRAKEIVVNVIFPFIYAWACLYDEGIIERKSLDLYQNHPMLEKNQIIDHMMQQLLLDPLTKLAACQQQGLIYIFKSWCRARNCSQCIINLGRG